MGYALSVFCYGGEVLNPKINCTLVVDSDDWFSISINYSQILNVYDTSHLLELKPLIGKMTSGAGRIHSDGLRGVVANSKPVAATVVVLQEHGGVLIEVARVNSSDGAWSFDSLPDTTTHVLAFRDGYNVGVAGYIIPGVEE